MPATSAVAKAKPRSRSTARRSTKAAPSVVVPEIALQRPSGPKLGEFQQWDVREAVRGNIGHAYTATSYIGRQCGQAVARASLAIVRDDGTSDLVPKQWSLNLIKRPYPEMPGVHFWALCSIWADLAGHFALWKIRASDRDPRVIALVPLLPDRVRIVLGSDRPIAGMNYYPDGYGGRSIGIPRDDLIRHSEPDPSGGYLTGGAGFYGWPRMRAALQSRELAEKNLQMRLAFYQNQARPDYVLAPELPKGKDAKDVLRRVRASVMIHHQGIDRYGMPLIVPKGTEVKTLDYVSEAMDLIAQAKLSRDDVFEIFGTSPVLHGHYEAAPARATLEAARAECAIATLDPRVSDIVGALQSDLIDPHVNAEQPEGRRVELRVASLAPDDAAANQIKATAAFAGNILRRNEARALLGAPPDEEDGYRYELEPLPALGGLSQAQAVRAVRSAAGREIDRALCLRAAHEIASKGALADDTARAIYGAPARVVEVEAKALPPAPEPTRKRIDIDVSTPESRGDYWTKAVASMDSEAARGTRVVRSVLRAQGERVIPRIVDALPKLVGKFAGWSRTKVLKHFATKAVDLGVDWREEDEAIAEALSPFVRSSTQRGGDSLAVRLGIDWSVDNPAATRWLESHVPTLAGNVNDTTASLIGNEIRYGVAEGESVDEITQRIRETWRTWEGVGADGDGVMPGYRAARIARTEVSTAFGFAQLDVMTSAAEAGIAEEWVWVSARDGVVRDSHQIDGERRKVGEKFSNGCEYPGDPAAGVEEIVNCRCTAAPVVIGGGDT